MAHYYPKISAPFGRKTPKDKLVDTSIYARGWVQMFVENNVVMLGQEKIDGTSVGIVWDGEAWTNLSLETANDNSRCYQYG